ncbi:hypothetical protein BT96DRAFT_995327 [Gymnopus androsaceus JB14]|uniref:Uncharacterized protein n=1 Tax=Gymnopus androsaceus JB14 TaxID=1447944 RepID=A0A6A4HLE4_9AGAR|nr:hypothetical protein BT96DRAFT_995327 [Gymnopus androsaceus JB14]
MRYKYLFWVAQIASCNTLRVIALHLLLLLLAFSINNAQNLWLQQQCEIGSPANNGPGPRKLPRKLEGFEGFAGHLGGCRITVQDGPIQPATESSGGLEGELRFSPPHSPVSSESSASQPAPQAERNNSPSPLASGMPGEMRHNDPTFFIPYILPWAGPHRIDDQSKINTDHMLDGCGLSINPGEDIHNPSNALFFIPEVNNAMSTLNMFNYGFEYDASCVYRVGSTQVGLCGQPLEPTDFTNTLVAIPFQHQRFDTHFPFHPDSFSLPSGPSPPFGQCPRHVPLTMPYYSESSANPTKGSLLFMESSTSGLWGSRITTNFGPAQTVPGDAPSLQYTGYNYLSLYGTTTRGGEWHASLSEYHALGNNVEDWIFNKQAYTKKQASIQRSLETSFLALWRTSNNQAREERVEQARKWALESKTKSTMQIRRTMRRTGR